jgi:hypothetical protein
MCSCNMDKPFVWGRIPTVAIADINLKSLVCRPVIRKVTGGFVWNVSSADILISSLNVWDLVLPFNASSPGDLY